MSWAAENFIKIAFGKTMDWMRTSRDPYEF